jgi:hypothetical protein
VRILALAVALAVVSPASAITLARHGRAEARVFLARDAAVPERTAAAEEEAVRSEAFVFIRLPEPPDPPEYSIVPSQTVARSIHLTPHHSAARRVLSSVG